MSISSVFEYYDGNGDGKISCQELSRVMQQLDSQKWGDKETLMKMFRQVDKDESGTIEYREFLAWVFGAQVGQQAVDVVAKKAVEVSGHPKSDFAYQALGLFPGPISIADVKLALAPRFSLSPSSVLTGLDIVLREKAKLDVMLDRSSGQSTGMSYKKIVYNGHQALEILKIEDGLLKTWNSENPTQLVEYGDLIISINSVQDDLQDGLSKQEPLRLSVQKTRGTYTERNLGNSEVVQAASLHVRCNVEGAALLTKEEAVAFATAADESAANN
eukprot:TRINITY_DN91057_c0_g1_i1.p1 TRINITY_DN91057_c0_g1~~TRINITY_DN91057_c0_g1_i1.p1  ORF type:complete len:273 (-),score=50.40 TRINITY_DN91057_c0_g1_i1:201-1019(-)